MIEYIVSFSGGKDSTAMLLMMLERGEKMQPDYPDYILHINEYLKVKYQVVARLAGEEYHFEIRKTPYKAWNLAKKLAEGVELIKERIEKESKIAKVLSSRLVFVGIHDSLESGNCRSESETLKTKISDMFDGEIGGVSHDFLFENRNDIYTKRAVEQAASRFIKENEVINKLIITSSGQAAYRRET